MPISHSFTSAIADDPTAAAAGQVLPSHWNAGHTLPSHTELSDIGTKTHAQIDTALNALGGASLLAVGTTAGTVAAGDDSRLSDSRTPTAHKTSHATGQSDAIAPSDIGAQATLVSATNIKTINSTSLLGSGDIAISASPGGSTTQVQFNDASAFGGAPGVLYNKATGQLTGPTDSNTFGGTALKVESYLRITSGIMALGGASDIACIFNGANTAVGLVLASDYPLSWAPNSGGGGGNVTRLNDAQDIGLRRDSAGVLRVTDGGTTNLRDLKLRNLIADNTVVLKSFTVGTLPSAATSGAGALAMATDLISLVNGTTATTGGSLKGVCKSDGSAWIVLG